MAAAVAVWRGSSPDSIETDLAALWREAARQGPVARALMSNLVLVREHRPRAEGGSRELPAGEDALVEVARRHPVRAILLDDTTAAATARAPDAPRVGLVMFGQDPLRYGVELIAIHAACAEASAPSIVRCLVRGDVPTTIWWTGDLSERSAPDAMTMIGRQFVCDSASWRDGRTGIRSVAALLAQPHAPDVADLNWRRLAPMRRAVVYGVACEPDASDRPPVGARIEHSPGRAAGAWLLAGWLRSRLSWTSSDLPVVAEHHEPADELRVTLEGHDWRVSVSMGPECVKVAGTKQPAFEVLRPRESVAECVAAEMRSLGYDTALRDAVAALASR